MKCGGRTISEYDDDLPKDLSVEDILVHSSNIGSVKIGQIIGKEKMREFLIRIGMLDKMKFDIEGVEIPYLSNGGIVNLRQYPMDMELPLHQFNLLEAAILSNRL